MDEFESHCDELDEYERLAELDINAEDLVFWKEGGHGYKEPEFDLDVVDIQFKMGQIYKKTFAELLDESGKDTILTDDGKKQDKDIGRMMKELHRLVVRVYLDSSKFGSTNQALESAINKIIVHNEDEGILALDGTEPTPSQTFLQILQSIPHETQKTILEKGSGKRALVRKLEEPLMTTELWTHQREALYKWISHGFQGYVDMATATGKTVLGIATIASLYGELHPDDQTDKTREMKESGVNIMVVAHDNLVLEQWGRELDEHLQIPRKFTGLSEDEELTDIKLDWGSIKFVTGQKLQNMTKNNPQQLSSYDLLILDEIHKYYKVVGRMSSLIDNDRIKIMALSGSIDVKKSKRQEVRNHLNGHLSLLKRYTIQEAREDDIIPDFSWNIIYTTPQYEGERRAKLKRNSKECKKWYKKIQKMEDIPSFKSYSEAGDFRRTIEGNHLRKDFDAYDNFVHAFMERDGHLFNINPSLETMSKVIEKEAKDKKCLALLSSNPNVRKLESKLMSQTDLDEEHIVTIGTEDRKAHEQRSIIDDFDESNEPGVIIGTGKRLGVGVDFMNIEAIVNATSGRKVNKSLIQRMGRMLRNPPEKQKTPVFYNVVPFLEDEDVRISEREGRALIEGMSQYLGLADSIECTPGKDFGVSLAPESLEQSFIDVENAGIAHIKTLIDEDSYNEPPVIGKDSEGKKSSSKYLREEVVGSETPSSKSVILEKWGKKEDDQKPDNEEKKEKKEGEMKTTKTTTQKKESKPEKKKDEDSLKDKIKGAFKKVTKRF